MIFSVIYSFDCPRDISVNDYYPSKRRLFDLTEQSDTVADAEIEGMPKHRKLCGILTREQFEEFLWDVQIYAEDVETMGSLGAPGLGFGLSPAISFGGDDYNAYQNAYVTPLPETTKSELNERDWQRVRTAVINTYG